MSRVMARLRASRDESGFTLVEVLAALLLFALMSTAVFGVLKSTRSTATVSKQSNDINEEARLALNRMTRELRQAKAITSASTPNGSTSITFTVDFNGNKVIDQNALDPEILTYAYDTTAKQILLTANDPSGTPVTRPILAGNVSSFCIDYRSSKYAYQVAGAQTTTCGQSVTGTTTWQNLDSGAVSAGFGNSNNALDGPELGAVDSIVLNVTVLQGVHQQVYRTQVDLRNQG
ncbi:MAG: prepilin-type N-terminal cleavage/methylation domain-containing protein [Frankiaceae bacterium]|nr:prepilin-type N-terminal cleavage/methylation domain-containing protein [Frankiaceae bacterium]